MPTYDYECSECGHRFEKFQGMTAKPIKKCPKCGKMKLRRLIGIGAGVIFKGSGFYQTDYRSSGYREAARKDSTTTASVAASAAGSKTTVNSDKTDKKTSKK